MVGKIDKNPQLSMFQVPLIQFINLEHGLCVLARSISWDDIEKEFAGYYIDFGRPSVPVRKIVGLILLKYLYNESDESVVEKWIENPYWQYFCGEVNFQKNGPFDPSEFVHFRKRIGEEGAEKLLKLSIKLFGKDALEKEVLIDTTVQEKNITYPTDTKLHKKIIDKCNKIAEKECLEIRQSYKRTIKPLMQAQRFRNHPKRKKAANAAARKIKTIAGRLVRDISRKLDKKQNDVYENELIIFRKILAQVKDTKNKIYSIHEPDVLCIAKGKEAKKYEYGNKSSIVKTKTTGIIVGALAFHENIYDGDTLLPQLNQVERLTGGKPKIGIADRGYRGRAQINGIQIVIPRPLHKGTSKYEKLKTRKRFRARAGIEPIIGHIKHDHRMLRNYLKGTQGDSINTMLAAAAFNLKKKINQIKEEIKNLLLNIYRYNFSFKFQILLQY
jgi:IS5 family transposase